MQPSKKLLTNNFTCYRQCAKLWKMSKLTMCTDINNQKYWDQHPILKLIMNVYWPSYESENSGEDVLIKTLLL